MLRNRFRASLAGCVVCGSAFAGGMVARGATPDRALVGGLLVSVTSAAFATLVYFARLADSSTKPVAAKEKPRRELA